MSDDWTPGAGSRTLTPEAGMLGLGGRRVTYVAGGVYNDDLRSGLPVAQWPGADLTDPATRYLALAQLARRVGLDSAWGCLLCYEGVEYGGWSLRVVGRRWLRLYSPEIAPSRIVGRLTHGEDFSWLVVPGINTDDALDALDRALWATRGTP